MAILLVKDIWKINNEKTRAIYLSQNIKKNSKQTRFALFTGHSQGKVCINANDTHWFKKKKKFQAVYRQLLKSLNSGDILTSIDTERANIPSLITSFADI